MILLGGGDAKFTVTDDLPHIDTSASSLKTGFHQAQNPPHSDFPTADISSWS